MEVEKHLAGGAGTGGFCLYWYDCLADKRTHLFAFRSRHGEGRLLEDRPLSAFSSTLVPSFSVDLWLFIWPIPFFLGEGKAIYKTNGKAFFPRLIDHEAGTASYHL